VNVADVIQGTESWKAARVGRVTASRLCDVLSKLKSGGEAASRRNYKADLVVELLTGVPQDAGYVSADMQRGTELEPLARAAYEIHTGQLVEQVGFVFHPTIERSGCSPDGIIGEDGGLEIKVPRVATHIEWMLAGKIPAEHEAQILWSLACTGREWWDFCSYSLELPENLQLFTRRMIRDDKRIAEMEKEVEKFLAEVDETLAALNKLCPEPAIA
jgi:hypothetical protein